jgi:hypothetical protein
MAIKRRNRSSDMYNQACYVRQVTSGRSSEGNRSVISVHPTRDYRRQTPAAVARAASRPAAMHCLRVIYISVEHLLNSPRPSLIEAPLSSGGPPRVYCSLAIPRACPTGRVSVRHNLLPRVCDTCIPSHWIPSTLVACDIKKLKFRTKKPRLDNRESPLTRKQSA